MLSSSRRHSTSLMVQKGADKRKDEDLMKAFEQADKDNDGFLSMEEYVKVFSEHGVNISKEEVALYFSSKDRDRDGRISYEEFCGKKTVNEKAFEALDINSDGYISKQELMIASQRTGRRLSKTEVDATFREYDHNKDNKLSYKEFCVMMNRKKEVLTSGEGSGSREATSGESTSKSREQTRSNLKECLSGSRKPSTEDPAPSRKHSVK